MLAVAQKTGLVTVLQKAIPLNQALTTTRLAHHRPVTLRHLLQTLLFMPLARQYRPWDLRSYTGRQLALLSGRLKTYSYPTVERFVSELARCGANESLTDTLANWTYHLWQPQFQTEAEAEQGLGPLFYVDGHHKAVYTSKLIPRGLVGRLGKILGCRAIVLLHDTHGHPLLALTGRGDQHLTAALPQIVARFERANGPVFKINRIVADREAMAGEFLANSLLAGQAVVTLLKDNQYQAETSFGHLGEFVPWLFDRQGKLDREVAPAKFNLSVISPTTGQPLELKVALIRDWRRHKRDPSTAPKLVPVVTTSLEANPTLLNSSEALALATTYRQRWPLQENIIKDWLLPLGLDINHGFRMIPVENSQVSKRRTYLQQRITTTLKYAHSAKRRQQKASAQYDKRHLKLRTTSRKLYDELERQYEGMLRESERAGFHHNLSAKQKLEYYSAKERVKEKLLDLEELKWQAYSASNKEYRKEQEYYRQQAALEKELSALNEREQQMLELDNAKDQVMSVFKLALANLGMWLREQCFPDNYAGCSWERLTPFFSLGGWVQEVNEVVRVELESFNNRRLNQDLAAVCEKVNQAELRLPDGRRLEVALKSEKAQPEGAGLGPPAAIPLYTVTSKVA